MEMFKIRNPLGKYWTGKKEVFNDIGKTWNTQAYAQKALENHNRFWVKNENGVGNHIEVILPEYLLACEIVKFELIEIEITPITR